MSSFHADLVDALAAEFGGEWREDLASVTGALTDAEIADLVVELVHTRLDSTPTRVLVVTKSVGFVVGIELEGDQRVALKFFDSARSLAELGAIHRCLRHLAASGFPATPPRSEAFVTGHGQIACFYEYITGELRTGHEPAVRRELAARLAQFSSAVRGLDTRGLPEAPGHQDDLWQPSHRSFLSLAPHPGSAWIDDLARRAQQVLKASKLPPMPAHMDWGVKNARFDGDAIVAVYDWDSICRASEAEMVGRAAAQFTAQWDLPAPITPSAGESRAFVEDYEAAGGRRFGPREWRVMEAAAQYLTAQVARLEAALPEAPMDGFLDRLRRARGERILS